MDDKLYIFLILIPIVFLIYSIITFENKTIIYTVNDNDIKVAKSSYYILQLLFCIINAVLLGIEIKIFYNKIDVRYFILIYVISFWTINFLLKYIAFKNKYLKR